MIFTNFSLYLVFGRFFQGSGFFADPDSGEKSDPDPDKRTRGYETLNNLCESGEI